MPVVGFNLNCNIYNIGTLCTVKQLNCRHKGAAVSTVYSLIPGVFLFALQDGTCKFKPELAAAFVKEVVNITKVSTE